MQFTVKTGAPDKQKTACLVVAVFPSKRMSTAAETIDQASDGAISALFRRGDISGENGQFLLLQSLPNVNAERILLVGCGKERELTDARFRSIHGETLAYLDKAGVADAVSFLGDLALKNRNLHWKLREAAVALGTAAYRFDQFKTKPAAKPSKLKKFVFCVATRRELTAGETGLREAEAINAGMNLTRDLGNLPANVCTPTYLAEQAQGLKKLSRKLKVEVLEEAAMEKLGMGSLLSVARGSRQPAKLIIMHYQGGKTGQKPIALVGKAVTFDTGGISLKPGAAMDEMKFDMCGGATVLGVIKAAAILGLPINLIGAVPATENMPDGLATRPGDIVTSLSGQTIEILNTDAEGRLILCDALTYCERFDPEVVIDIATLTGACIIALGEHAAGLLSNHSGFASELMQAGQASGDRCWELPLWPEYQEQLKSNFADMANIGGKSAGTITAACFLSRFTEKFRWAHLDIAGVAWKSGRDKGASGRPLPLLMQFLMDRAGK